MAVVTSQVSGSCSCGMETAWEVGGDSRTCGHLGGASPETLLVQCLSLRTVVSTPASSRPGKPVPMWPCPVLLHPHMCPVLSHILGILFLGTHLASELPGPGSHWTVSCSHPEWCWLIGCWCLCGQSDPLRGAWLHNTAEGDTKPRRANAASVQMACGARDNPNPLDLCGSVTPPSRWRHVISCDPPSATAVSVKSNNEKAFPRDGQETQSGLVCAL